MGKTYKNLTTGTDNITKPRNMMIASPYDVRTVVDTYDDLFDKSVFTYGELYVGLLVITQDTQDVYVLSQLPGPRDNATKWAENIKWKKVSSPEINVGDVITFDGSAPAAGTGFSISDDDSDAIIEETYVNNGFEAGKYYTGRGLNSSDENGGEDIDADYITLTNGGDSSITLNSADNPNWIELNIVDDSLGFTMEDVTWIDENGVEHQMTENPLVLPKETPISFGDKTVDFNGMTETRGDDPTTYIFGDTGSSYDEADIYTSTVLPTVYVYSNGESVKVLTEGDKDDLLDKIEANNMEPLTREEVLSVF